MSSQPSWDSVDNYTSDLLDLVATDPHPSSDREWRDYVACLRMAAAAGVDNTIDPNRLRFMVSGNIAPRRIGAFTHRALSQGLVEYTGRYVISTDTKGRNGGKPCRELRWIGGRP